MYSLTANLAIIEYYEAIKIKVLKPIFLVCAIKLRETLALIFLYWDMLASRLVCADPDCDYKESCGY